jgi:UDP-3-O-[3-hydroxymyristoyl] glucosamine N-acyltransferase
MKLSEIAAIVGGETAGGGDCEIRRLAKIEEAGAGDITFLANPKYRKHLATTAASAVLISPSDAAEIPPDRPSPLLAVCVADPYLAFVRLIDVFYPEAAHPVPGIHATAVLGKGSVTGTGVSIGAHAVIGERCSLGDGAVIGAGAVIGDDVTVGSRSTIGANVTVREQCRVGNNVMIHPGTVIGSDGFGFAPQPDGTYKKIPQRGIVVIEDDVEIGANCTIDRATLGETRIETGVKLDNLIQIAHNVVVGRHTVIAAQTGISGSTRIGEYCAIAGQVGFVGHVHIAEHTTIGAQSGIHKGISEPGKTWFGYPARPIQEQLRIEGAIRQLPELLRTIRDLQKRIEELESLQQAQKPITR